MQYFRFIPQKRKPWVFLIFFFLNWIFFPDLVEGRIVIFGGIQSLHSTLHTEMDQSEPSDMVRGSSYHLHLP